MSTLDEIQYLFKSNGAINGSFLKNIQDDIRLRIIEETNFLRNDPNLSQRVRCIQYGVTEHESCVFCKKLLRYSNHKGILFNRVCSCDEYKRSILDRFKPIAVEKLKQNFLLKKKRFKPEPILTLEETVNILKANIELVKNSSQYDLKQFIDNNTGLRESIYFYSSGKKLGEKITRLIYSDSCEVCGKKTSYISRSLGFRQVCSDHHNGSENKRLNSLDKANALIESFGYKIIIIPSGLQDSPYILECTNGHQFEKWMNNGKMHFDLSKICPRCFPRTISNQEFEIREWLESYNIEVISQYRYDKNSFKTIDLYLPKYDIGIEFNGVMWHSFGKSEHAMFNNYLNENKNRHLEKTRICEENGIQLFHIFSNEWDQSDTKRNIWKSVILNKCGLSERKIYARQCLINIIDAKQYKKFMEENHLQGFAAASIKYGLFFNDEMVACCGFSKNRFSNKADYELIRFVSKINVSVIGGFSRLIKHFTRENPGKSIISYANMRWSIGNVYVKNNFKYVGTSSPNYFYVDPKTKEFHSRQKFQRHKLDDNSDATESQIMFDRGYRRIWDCGNLVYVYSV